MFEFDAGCLVGADSGLGWRTHEPKAQSSAQFWLSVKQGREGADLVEGGQGRFLFFFGSSGDLDFARMLMDRSGLRRTVVDRLERERDGRLVEYVAYRLNG
ncbi:hypothetical protein [Streptomyces sp. WM6378]|uniref:hypothetical protein n=1 Tax=Streptomyces sp. WM6378 TaxID=1415557 RepID=UPI0006AF1C14|nr:hypothetical protein [Streptomyces sp. WM6378]KOU36199.1 hypothetical protein ADK54_34695 [Streptomyces sp. WM6378]